VEANPLVGEAKQGAKAENADEENRQGASTGPGAVPIHYRWKKKGNGAVTV
jgi:hypothetical protein